jgi:hypothetical protein
MPEPEDSADPGDRAWNLPWAEPFTAAEPERAELAGAFGVAIRKTGSLMQLMNQAAADRIGINPTDLNCLNILSFRGQMTAGETPADLCPRSRAARGLVAGPGRAGRRPWPGGRDQGRRG